MSVLQHAVKRGRYFDSVVLMQLQRRLGEMEGVHRVGVMMATAANQELLVASGLLRKPLAEARADDLVIALDAATARVAARALELFDELARGRQAAVTADYRPKSLRAAVGRLPAANWVLVSVPGRYAASVARQALAAGCNVFLYSDNVALADEAALKAEARARGLLVLGPDCGTAIVAGVGLGFANRVRRGPIALVGASGTGLQSVASRVHALGSGISQAVGTGGRDLSREVAAATTLQALDLLAADAATEAIVIVSKPPHREVAARVLERARALGRPVVVQFQGFAPPRRALGAVHFAADLEDAARLAVALVGAPPRAAEAASAAGSIRGLFSGGTLAGEALLALEAMLPQVTSNLGGHRAEKHAAAHAARGHVVLDLGADELTVGRPHPMIDPQLVVEHLARAAAEEEVTTVLLDVVLGDGAHPDPAALLAPAIEKAVGRRGGRLVVCALLVGTDEDRQELETQRERLAAAGAEVCLTLGEALERALAHSAPPAAAPKPETRPESTALAPPLAAVNVGLELFYDALVAQQVEAVHVDWRPPAGGNERLGRILERLRQPAAVEAGE